MLAVARTLMLVALFGSILPAQILSGAFTPPVGTPGSVMTLRLSNGSTSSVTLQNGCGYNAIVSGSPTGPVAFAPLICPLIIITIGPCASRNVSFQLPNTLTSGLYYVRVNYNVGTTGPLASEFFPFSVQGASAPTLAVVPPTTPQIGTSLLCNITAPGFGGGFYIAAASFSANVGFPLSPTLYVALDQDLLFNLSFPAPDPTLFANFQDALTGAGNSVNNLTVNIPNFPFLTWKGMVIQAGVVDAFGTTALTNPLSFTFLP